MLKKHIIDALGKSTLSAEQKQQVLELLLSIKENDTLITEFIDTDTPSLRASLSINEQTETENETFFTDEFDLSEELNLSQVSIEEESQSDTFFGTEFDLSGASTQDDIQSLETIVPASASSDDLDKVQG